MSKLAVLLAFAGTLSAGPGELRDTAGKPHQAAEWLGRRAVVLFFLMTDCPLANAYVPEMNRIAKEYAGGGVAVYGVHSDPFTGEPAVKAHVAGFGYEFPVLLDPKLTMATMAGATTVPEVAVFSGAGRLLYLGRIDNRVEDITHRRPAATVHELRDALDAILAGKAPAAARTKAIGCSINLEFVK